MKTFPLFANRSFLTGWVVALLLASGISAFAAPPDLTNGGVPTTTTNLNLGPTGLRGWMYHVGTDTSESRQIQVQVVDAGSPASGKLAVNDVILGANGTGANPVNFTADARISLANAINDAEARTPAELKVRRWRAGTTTTQTLTLTTMGAYTATAPYNCPKSALILEKGLQAIMAGEAAGTHSLGTLTLLAGNDPGNPLNAARQLRAQTEARALIPDAATIARMTSGELDELGPDPLDPWQQGHELVVLTEYYLRTNDALVLPAINAMSKCIITGQNLFGTYSHRYASKWRDGSPNGPMRNFYGSVNNTSMTGWLGLLLTKQCGVVNPDLDPAITRASRFYSYYAGKGVVPYGEHPTGTNGHENNGKSGLAALCFELEDHRTSEQKFFAKMALAATSEREIGHTGPFFNQLWSPLGAAAGGQTAAASCFSRLRWRFDLSRRWNGTFSYDTLGESPEQSGTSYYDFSPSIASLLVYALPLRQLHITGGGHDPLRWLSAQDVAEAAVADVYVATSRTTNQLMTDLANWSPKTRTFAAEELGKRTTQTTALLPTLHAMATDLQGTSRVGACQALGTIHHASSAAVLADLLDDPVNHVRLMAAGAMMSIPQSARLPHLNTILTAAASTSAPLLPFNEEDPAHFTHAAFGPLLFDSNGVIPASLNGINRNFLYPAIRAVAKNPTGFCRSHLARIYNNLSQTDYLALADTVVDSAYDLTPADKMFAYQDRLAAQRLLERFNAAEGVPVSLLSIEDGMYGDVSKDALGTLQLYAGGSTTVQPDPDVPAAMNFLIQSGSSVAEAQAVLAAIAGDPNPATLIPLKSIQSAIPDAPSLTLPANSTVLRVTASDYAKGDSVYTWRKIHGAGAVTFTPNGTGAAKDATILFDGTPGRYLFEVTMSDSKNLTEVYSTVAYTLYNSGGTLPTNNPPVANNQSPSITQETPTPITLTASDPEGYALNYLVTSQPAHGTLGGSAPNLVYTPSPNYTGLDSFNFSVTDSEGQTSAATVSITVVAGPYPFMALTGDASTVAGYWYSANELDGYTFTVGTHDIKVDWLGWYDAKNDGAGAIGDGFMGSIQMGIWDTVTGELLVQLLLPAGTPGAMSGSFRGMSITPLTLTSGTNYTIAGYGAGVDRIQGTLTGFTTKGITVGSGSVYGYSWPSMPTEGWSHLIGANFGGTILVPDTTAPTPNPMTWAAPPASLNFTTITMTATTASDPSGVEYYFDETSGNPGGTDSAWQDSPIYTDSGLNPSTTYTYQVKARDKLSTSFVTTPSSPVQATTGAHELYSAKLWASGRGWATDDNPSAWVNTDGSPKVENQATLTIEPGETAGVWPTDVWNNINVRATNTGILNGSLGGTATFTVVQKRNDSSYHWTTLRDGSSAVTPGVNDAYMNNGNATLFDGHLNATESDGGPPLPERNAVIEVSGITLPLYDVIIYFGISNGLEYDNIGFINFNGGGLTTFTLPAGQPSTTLDEIEAPGAAGNYIKYTNVAGSSFSARVYGQGFTHMGPSGIQIRAADSTARIATFGIPGSAGVIDQNAKTISLTVPFGTDLGTLAPDFTLASGTCNQTTGLPPAPNFSVTNPATYTVTDTATDPDTVNDYTVQVNVTPVGTACDILTFNANFPYSDTVITTTSPTTGTVVVSVPTGTTGTQIAALAPSFTLSAFASCNQPNSIIPTPALSTTTPVTYIVTAQDGITTKNYSVSVVVEPLPPAFMALTGDAPSAAGYWYSANELDGYQFTVGANDISMNWLGWYDAKNSGAGAIGDGFMGSIKMGVWDTNTGTLLAQLLLPAGTPGAMSGSFRGKHITPVTLTAGTTYTIAGYGAGFDQIHEITTLTGFTANGITVGPGGEYGYSWPSMPGIDWQYLLGANFGGTIVVGSAYDTWKAANAPGSNPDDDTDGDGVENAVEFVLGGTSSTKDLDKLPVLTFSGSDMLFTFYRVQSSIGPKTSTTIEVGTDLLTWPSQTAVPDLAATNNPGVTVEKNNPSVGTDMITLRATKTPDTKKFARMKVAITP